MPFAKKKKIKMSSERMEIYFCKWYAKKIFNTVYLPHGMVVKCYCGTVILCNYELC